MTSKTNDRVKMLVFCLRSCFRVYGWHFFRHMMLPHPVKTIKSFFRAMNLENSDLAFRTQAKPDENTAANRSVVGVGFCLKPMNPPCPSGRANHDCQYLEDYTGLNGKVIPESCQKCAIREIGVDALRSGHALYIMTSARDILFDVFLPSLRKKHFLSGIFALCRYSFEPFAVGLLISDINGKLYSYENGDCLDYRTWLQADRGIKDDQTTLNVSIHQKIMKILEKPEYKKKTEESFIKSGNILYPEEWFQ